MDSWYEFHTGAHQELNEAIERSQNTYVPRFAQALQGEAGDALQARLRQNHQLWASHADSHQAAGRASYQASCIVQRAQRDIDLIAEAGEEEFHDAVQRHDPVKALQVWRTYSQQADGVVSETAPKVGRVLQEAGFGIPLDTPPKPGDGAQTDGDDTKPKLEPAKNEHHKDGTQTEAKPGDRTDGTQSDVTPGDGNPPSLVKPAGDATQTDLLPQPGQTPFMPTNFGPGGGGNGLGSGGGGARMPSLGSGLPSQMGSMGGLGGLGAGTSPASAMPQAPGGGAASPASVSSLASTGSSFQSGLASGMGATGGMSAPLTPPAQPAQPLASTQPPVALPGTAGAGMGPAGVQAAPGWAAQPVDSAGVSGGQAGGGTPQAGGGGVMPPAAMAAQPLAPYSPPGAGAPGAGTAAPGAPTSPAGGSSAGGPGVGGGGGPASGGPGAAPMLTGNPGSSGALSALAASSSDMNPDVLTAQRILGELAHGSEASKTLVLWAVMVLRSPVGTHIAVANNVGGGAYLPATVYLPSTVRLAVSDPALPLGWADLWMGCRFPSKILIDYADRLTKVIAGASVSALVTTELWAEAPHDFTGDFLGMNHRDALRLVNEAPKLDAAHQHRLAVLDPGLYRRVNGLDRGGDMSAWAAATLTRTVFEAALKPDGTGAPLVEQADAQMLQAVSSGAATTAMWSDYDRAVAQRHDGAAMWPDQHAPRDNDDSDLARAAILWYSHYFRIGRMIELIQCWKTGSPRLAELVYCAIKAGFGPTVVTTIAAMEQHLAQQRR
ncbi:hypothetical protein PJO52_15185 [Mycobacterium kansasii]